MATLTVHVIPHAGLVLASAAFAAAGGSGDKAPTGPGIILIVKNGDSASHTVTLTVPETVDALPVSPRDVVIAAGDTAYIPLQDLYKQSSDGLAHWTYDAGTSVTVAVIRAS